MNELKDCTFAEIQKEYWKRVILNYVDSVSDGNEQEEFREALYVVDENGQTGIDNIIERLINDDAVWTEVDASIDYYLRLLFNRKPDAGPKTFLYMVDMILRDSVLANFEIEAKSEDEAREIVDKLFVDTEVTDAGKVELVVHQEDYDEDNIIITFTNDMWEEKDLKNIQHNVENIEFCLQKEKKED